MEAMEASSSFPPPPLVQPVYPYCKKPAHLTTQEVGLLSDASDAFQLTNIALDGTEQTRNSITKGREGLRKLDKHWSLVEEKLAEQEKAAVRTRDPIKRKKLEEECKHLRTTFINGQKQKTELEQKGDQLEEEVTQLEQAAHARSIDNVRALVMICEGVRRRREAEENTRGRDGRGRARGRRGGRGRSTAAGDVGRGGGV